MASFFRNGGMNSWEGERAALVAEIKAEVRATASYTGRDHLRASVLDAIGRVPRHRFIAPELEDSAYLDAPLSIGHGQTISQPYIVALMTDLAELEADARVLEIGTGSGYQAAVLAELAAEVYSIERVAALADSATRCLQELGYTHVQVKAGDGYQGWPEHAPYDAILVTAAVPEPPPALLAQLKPGGRLVLPLGRPGAKQELTVITRQGEEGYAIRPVLPVTFVPFLRGETDT